VFLAPEEAVTQPGRPALSRGLAAQPPFAYQHPASGPNPGAPDDGKAFAFRPTSGRDQIEVFWTQRDEWGVAWPYAMHRYTAGTLIQPPFPLSLFQACPESEGVSGPFWRDRKDSFWAKAAGDGGEPAELVMRWFYPVQTGFYFPADYYAPATKPPAPGSHVPWLDRRAGPKGQPINVAYTITWPVNPPTLSVGETLVRPKRGLPDISEQVSVEVIYQQSAANQVGESVKLTYREHYVEDPSGQWQGYQDANKDRAWSLSEWGSRAGQGAYFDWVVGNALLPDQDPTLKDEDTTNDHQGIQIVDRTTVTELREVAAAFITIQEQLDKADLGLNPLGLAKNVLPFDIDPSEIDQGKTHFNYIDQTELAGIVTLNSQPSTLNSFTGHWEGTLPDGTRLEFGLRPQGRIQDASADPPRVFCWLLERSIDTQGNTIVYSYASFPHRDESRSEVSRLNPLSAGRATVGRFSFRRARL
jgi:hypothetical protein